MYIHVCVCVYVDLTLQINWGGEVPQSLYLINNTEINKEDMELVVVGRGSSHQVEVEVDTKGTLLRWALFGAPVVQVRVSHCRWEYLSVDYDIGFGLFHKESSDKKKTHELTTIVSK